MGIGTYGEPGKIVLVPVVPSTGTHYLTALLLQANYEILKLGYTPQGFMEAT